MADEIETSSIDATNALDTESPSIAPLAADDIADTKHSDELARTLDEMAAAFTRHLVLPDGGSEAMAVWTAFTHIYEVFEHFPSLVIVSPVRGCGKTTTLRMLEKFVARPHFTANISPASMYHMLAGATLIADEMHTQNQRELQNAIDSGWSVGGAATRVIGGELTKLSTSYPKVMACIGRLPDEVEDRSWVVSLRRKLRSEQRDLLDRAALADAAKIGARLERIMKSIAPQLIDARPDIPPQFQNRAADNARPLLAIADVAGSHWPATLRDALSKLAAATPATMPVGEALLTALRDILSQTNHDEFPSQDLLAQLEAGSDAALWDLPPLTSKMLARHLSAFDIHSDRLTKARRRGYTRRQFDNAFARYLPPAA